jgi:diguanylate cyclase (GGDEF)-like protein/PAS domain S-box-containing protein
MNQEDFFPLSNYNQEIKFFGQNHWSMKLSYRDSLPPETQTVVESSRDSPSIEAMTLNLKLLPVPVVIISVENGLILYNNTHFSALLKISVDTLMGQSFLRYCQVKDWHACLNLLQTEECFSSYQLELTPPQALPCSVVLSAKRLTVGKQSLLFGICQDITEQQQELKSVHNPIQNPDTWVAKPLEDLHGINKCLVEEAKSQSRTEAALPESANKFRCLAESLPQQIWMTQKTGHCIYANRVMLRYLGCSLNEVVGFGWQKYVHPDDVIQTQSAIQEALANSTPYESTIRSRGADGIYRWYICRGVPVCTQTGEVIYWIGTNTDIDDYKQTEQALRESEERLDFALQAAKMGTWNWYRRSGELMWSKGLEQLYGMKPGEFDGSYQTFLSKIHERDRAGVIKAFEQAIKQGQEYDTEFRIVWDDGSIRWISSKGLVFCDQAGIPDHMAGVDMDITARRQAEESLRHTEAKYRSIFENAVEGIFQTTPDGQFLSVNPALATLYGYESPGELVAEIQDIAHQVYVNPSDRQTLLHQLETAPGVVTFETQVYRRDGIIIWIVEKVRAVRNIDGEILHYEGTVEDITERKRIKDQLHRQAYYDTLTELPNRGFFMERLRDIFDHPCATDSPDSNPSTRPSQYFALLFLDLDRFKNINDSLGHLVGDQLLIAVARRLEKCVRPADMVARLGGDEFTVLLNPIQDPQQVIQVADRIQSKLSEPFNINGHPVFTGASIGILFCNGRFHASSLLNLEQFVQDSNPIAYCTPEELLRDADTALYRAKALGKGRYEIFDQNMRQVVVQQLQLETEIRSALDSQSFNVHYQPIVSLSDGNLLGFEALLRWWHPSKGYVKPSQFIPVAEDTGLIVPLGVWIIREACQQLRTWQDQLPIESKLVIHINLSSKQFVWAELVNQIDCILTETGIEGSQLKLEIAESSWCHNIPTQVSCLEQLRARGINLCLDNFGVGYSSLKFLQQYSVEALKIDKSYVHSLTQVDSYLELTRTIVALAHSLGMSAIAEGIENAEQLRILRDLGCDKGQGYFFASALDAQTAEILIDAADSPFLD